MKQTLLALAVALAFGGPALAANEHDHGHGHGAQDAKLVLDHGKKWPTDEALRHGMENIRAALAAEKNKTTRISHPSPEDYAALAGWINQEVAGIVENCKLAPEADAQLHKVIGQIMAGAEVMEGKEKGVSPRTGALRVREALEQYGRYFDHPGWKL